MITRRDAPLPAEELRDLLGIVRALYAERRDRGAPPAQLKRIADVGRHLTIALEYANLPIGSVGQRSAWQHAETACAEAIVLLEVLEPAEPLVLAAMSRVRRGQA